MVTVPYLVTVGGRAARTGSIISKQLERHCGAGRFPEAQPAQSALRVPGSATQKLNGGKKELLFRATRSTVRYNKIVIHQDQTISRLFSPSLVQLIASSVCIRVPSSNVRPFCLRCRRPAGNALHWHACIESLMEKMHADRLGQHVLYVQYSTH
jgi:hypothetical protein